MTKTTFWIRWMNKTRFKKENGSLIINSAPRTEDEKEIRRKFLAYTQSGYACQLKCADLKLCDCINFSNNCKMEKSYIPVNDRVVEENDRWKLRVKDDEIRKLTIHKEHLENDLKATNEKLKKLQEE